MNPNPVASLIAGVVIVVAVGAGLWGVLFVVELVANMLKPLDKNMAAFLMSLPVILIITYLVGHGFLEFRHQNARHK